MRREGREEGRVLGAKGEGRRDLVTLHCDPGPGGDSWPSTHPPGPTPPRSPLQFRRYLSLEQDVWLSPRQTKLVGWNLRWRYKMEVDVEVGCREGDERVAMASWVDNIG